MPATPVLDEGKILQLLEGPMSTFLANPLNAGCMMAVMAARDRNLPREEFQSVLEKAVDLQRMVIRLQTLEVMRQRVQQPDFDKEMQKNVDYCTQQGEICRKNLEYQMNLIAQCPWEQDTLN